MDIGQAIKKLRLHYNMTQTQLGEMCGMSANAISSLETGKAFPPKSTVEKLCGAFDIPQSLFLMSSIEEGDFPEAKRTLFRAMLEPLRNELLEKSES